MNKENLKTLSSGLRLVKEKDFTMRDLRMTREGKRVFYMSRSKCGSVGCALGWAPTIPTLEPVHEDFRQIPHSSRGELSFTKYSKRIFDLSDAEWDWCFSCGWTYYDDTPTGAADRIDYLLDNGVPEDFSAGSSWGNFSKFVDIYTED